MIRMILRASMLCLVLGSPLPAYAQSAETLLDQRMAMLTEVLRLSPDQQIVVRELQGEQMRLVAGHIATAQADGSRRARLGAAREIRAVRVAVEEAMARVLSASQMAAYHVVLAEQEAAVRERFSRQ